MKMRGSRFAAIVAAVVIVVGGDVRADRAVEHRSPGGMMVGEAFLPSEEGKPRLRRYPSIVPNPAEIVRGDSVDCYALVDVGAGKEFGHGQFVVNRRVGPEYTTDQFNNGQVLRYTVTGEETASWPAPVITVSFEVFNRENIKKDGRRDRPGIKLGQRLPPLVLILRDKSDDPLAGLQKRIAELEAENAKLKQQPAADPAVQKQLEEKDKEIAQLREKLLEQSTAINAAARLAQRRRAPFVPRITFGEVEYQDADGNPANGIQVDLDNRQGKVLLTLEGAERYLAFLEGKPPRSFDGPSFTIEFERGTRKVLRVLAFQGGSASEVIIQPKGGM